jgi:hypothetical protein
VDKLPVVRFVGETPIVTLVDGSDAEFEALAAVRPASTKARHRASFMPSPWRGWCWRCRCGARGSALGYDAMLVAMGEHLDADRPEEPRALGA